MAGSLLERLAGLHDSGGRDAERFGASDQVRLMSFEEAQDRCQQRAIFQPGAQIVRAETGQPQQPFRPSGILERPAERGQRQCLVAGICFVKTHRLRYCPHYKGFRVAKKILVVEDNELNLKLFCDLLRAHGYEAEAVRDGREAVERTRAFAPDLVIMDIQMPHVSGLELIEQLKSDEALKSIPVMAVTAYAAKGDEERIRDAGAEGYVSKPISLMKFVESVGALLKVDAQP